MIEESTKSASAKVKHKMAEIKKWRKERDDSFESGYTSFIKIYFPSQQYLYVSTLLLIIPLFL